MTKPYNIFKLIRKLGIVGLKLSCAIIYRDRIDFWETKHYSSG